MSLWLVHLWDGQYNLYRPSLQVRLYDGLHRRKWRNGGVCQLQSYSAGGMSVCRQVPLTSIIYFRHPFNFLSGFIVPRFRESVGTLNLIRPSVRPSVCLSVCHKNFNLGHNFCTITDRALILGMCVPCDKTFPVVPCRDLDGDLWPSSRSNLLPSGGPQFSEFACSYKETIEQHNLKIICRL